MVIKTFSTPIEHTVLYICTLDSTVSGNIQVVCYDSLGYNEKRVKEEVGYWTSHCDQVVRYLMNRNGVDSSTASEP
jgi:hypothetical protein